MPASRARRVAPPRPTPPSRTTVPTAGWTRLLRTAVLGTASLLLAGLAHVVAGGRLPDLGLGLLLAAATGMVAVVLTARRCRLPLLLAVLGAEQLILHALFTADDATSCALPSAMPALHTGASPCGSDLVAQTLQHPLSLLMLSGHLVATALTAWLLARGEAALWRLAEQAVRASEATVTSWPTESRRVPVVAPLRALIAGVPEDDAPPRGPPRSCAAAG